jgi:O-Antigen ligase
MSVATLAVAERRVGRARDTTNARDASLWGRAAALTTAATIATFPLLQPSGPGNTSLPDVFAVLSIVSVLAWGHTSRRTMRLPYVLPVSLMVVAGALAALVGEYPGTGLVSLTQDLFMLAWCGAVVAVCQGPRGFALVVRTWAYSGVIWAVVLVVTVLGQIDFIAGITARTGSRAALTFGDPNLAAGYFDLCFMMVWASATPRRRAVRWLAYIALVTAVVLTGSNGFSLALVAAVVVAGTIGVCRRRGVLAGLATLCTALLLSGVVISQVNINTLVQDAAASSTVLRDYIGREAQSAQGRDALLQETLGLAVGGGIVGIGPGAVKPTLIAQAAPAEFEAHSDYTAALAERGLLGALGLLALISAVIWYARGALAPMRREVASVIVHPGALVGALITFAIGAGIYEVLHFRHLWALFGIIAALRIAALRSAGREAAA